MAKTNLSVKMNDKLAQEFEETCGQLGLSPDEAFNIFARRVVNEKAIPFEIKEEDYPDYLSTKDKVLGFVKKAALVFVVIGTANLVFHWLSPKEKENRFHF